MQIYECECLVCGAVTQAAFSAEPYPAYGENFPCACKVCRAQTPHTRTLTKKTQKEIRKRQAEQALRDSITDACQGQGFQCRFLYQSVIITTNLSDWAFDYHTNKVTLFHENANKINFKTGDYAKAHVQFRDRKMTPLEVIAYIAAHDRWKTQQLYADA